MTTTFSPKPYRSEAINKLYEMVFCDQPALFRPNEKVQDLYPWNVLFAASPSSKELLKLTEDKNIESRVKLLGYRILNAMNEPIASRELLGVVVEVPLDGGLDVLAAYKDGTARYINQSENVIIWESRTPASDKLIQHLFTSSSEVVSKIGAWDKPRLPKPASPDIRISFLVSDGLYFGQGPFNVLAKDPMGGPVVDAATQLMVFLTSYKKTSEV